MGGASGRKRKCWPVLATSTLAMEESQYREPVLDAKSEVSTGWEEKCLGRILALRRRYSKIVSLLPLQVTGQVSGRPARSAAACARPPPLLADPSRGCASLWHPKG